MRIAEAVVHAAQNHVHLLESFEGLEEYAAVAHRQIAALDQREAEIAREVGVLEVGFVERSGREQHDARMVARGGREVQQGLAKGAEKRSQPLDLELAEQIRKSFRHDDAVFERIAGAGRRLRAVGNHPPLPVRRRARSTASKCR